VVAWTRCRTRPQCCPTLLCKKAGQYIFWTTNLPLPSGINSPKSTSTPEIKNSRWRAVKIIKRKALTAACYEHMVPVIAVTSTVRTENLHHVKEKFTNSQCHWYISKARRPRQDAACTEALQGAYRRYSCLCLNRS
jgi:hypothetical protein